jgi:C4-dicarboxylate-specific signal transduction histidine kinase
MLCIAVADSGAGMSDEVAGRVVEPFATTTLIGLGLGLPICRQIADDHEGTITAGPNEPEGAVVTLCITRSTASAA